jgi:succinate dehydrogenase/fumarate reductase flavoprotein subunit
MAGEQNYDLVVVGAGAAGLTAARKAQELGGRVICLTKADEITAAGSNSRLSGGRIHSAYMDPHRPPQDLYDAIMAKTDGHARLELARAWSKNTGRAIDYLGAQGGVYGRGVPEYMWHQLQPPRHTDPSKAFSPDEWRGRGPDVLLRAMRTSFEDDGGDFRTSTPVVGLEHVDGRVTGVEIDGAGGRQTIRGRAIVLADGGFQANEELVHKYITTGYKLRGTTDDTGDCLLMATAIGAKTINMDGFYGHLVVKDDGDPRITVFPMPNILMDAAMVVDGNGHRVGDEALGPYDYSIIDDKLAPLVARSDTPAGCWLIFDERAWQEVATRGGPPSLNPTVLADPSPLVSGASLESIAEQTAIPAEQLLACARAFNQFATDGTPLTPPRTGQPKPIEQGPFHALPLIVGIMFAMGGLLVNANAQVLDEAEEPIGGLYAAGGTMGGLQGGPGNGYSGGWSEAATFGLLAAEHAMGSRPAGA